MLDKERAVVGLAPGRTAFVHQLVQNTGVNGYEQGERISEHNPSFAMLSANAREQEINGLGIRDLDLSNKCPIMKWLSTAQTRL